MDCFAALAMTARQFQTHHRILAARSARVLQILPPPRGRRECRAPDAPAAACAGGRKQKAHALVTVTPENTQHSPRNGLRLTSCSPRRPGFFATVAREKLASRELDTSVGVSGPHDFAVRIRRPSSKAPSASTASRPASVTIAIRPSCGTRRREYRIDLRFRKIRIFFAKGLDRRLAEGDVICPTRLSK